MMFVCAIAAKLPQAIVIAAIHMVNGPHSEAVAGNAAIKILSSAANPPAFAPTAIKAVTEEGAP